MEAATTDVATPVSLGVPFPLGYLREPLSLQLVAEDDRAVTSPAQVRTLARWPDGSVRWALVDAQLDVSADSKRAFLVESGAVPSEKARLTLEETGEAMVVDTGPLRFVVAKDRFALLDSLQIDGVPAEIGPLTTFLDAESRRHDAQAPASVRILERGPLRARIEVRGEFDAEFSYIARLDAYAGKPYVRILLTLEHHGARSYSSVRQLAVDLPWKTRTNAISYVAGRESLAPLVGQVSQVPVVLLQEDSQTLRRDGVAQEGRSAGWVVMRDRKRGVALASRFFWQEYPKSLQLEAERLRYNLWAPEVLPASIGLGVAKSHEFVLQFFGANSPNDEASATLAEPTIAHVDAGWTVDSGALRNSLQPSPEVDRFLDALRSGFSRFQQSVDSEVWDDWGGMTCSAVSGESPRRGYYGMLNWGDWNFPWYRDLVNGCETWGNQEYDLMQVLALGFAATGDPALHRFLTAAARHSMDVDRIHSRSAPHDSFGMTHAGVARHFSFERGGPNLGFVWTEGLLSYFYLTGDGRALDAVRGIADYVVRRLAEGADSLRPRQLGWSLIALVAAYEATGDVTWKRAIRSCAQSALRSYPPTSGGELGVGTLGDGLAYAHSVLPNESLWDWLQEHAAAVMSAPSGSADPRYFPAVAYVAGKTGNSAYERESRSALARQEFGGWGKPFTLAGRNGFRILSQFR